MTGRPQKDIDPNAVKLLAGAFCTSAEIAAQLGCSKDTLERRFAASLKEGRDAAKGSLRSKQFAQAMKGNVTMLIWLGKQYLAQTDRINVSNLSTEQIIAVLESEDDGGTDTAGGRAAD